jgi:Na+/H+ antiporter 1
MTRSMLAGAPVTGRSSIGDKVAPATTSTRTQAGQRKNRCGQPLPVDRAHARHHLRRSALPRWADCPEHASWAQVYGVSLLCGIGFTRSLFIGLLAFPISLELQDTVKIGVLSGSVLSAVVGTVVLAFARSESPQG